MTPEELDEITPRQFHNRLNGWKQRRQIESVETWRQTREIIAYTIPQLHWPKGQMPDIHQVMPLPGDPKTHAQLRAEESQADAAHRRYKAKAVQGRRGKAMNFDPDIEKLIRLHYQPDWGPHPDELVKKPKTDASTA